MDVSREFRFSPRPNRAAEIKWRPWGEPAFAEARRLGRPVLLSLSAVWCHWCHVMDETSYSDPRVIAAVNEHFVPVRVDNDRHPDVNRRYNMGGWPTTAFLAPSGDVLTGGTYLPPEQMLESLARVKAFFDANAVKIAALEGECAADGDGAARSRITGKPLAADLALEALEGDPDVPGDISAEVALQVVRAFDPLYGGLGAEPKFPQPDVFVFMLAYGMLRGAGDPDHVPEGGSALLRPARVHEVVRATLTAMAEGGLYDPVEGGFFRYATQRDWTVPHYEKMLEDNARLAGLYLEASLYARDHDLGDPELYRRAGEGAIDYLLTVLWRDEAEAFGGSQDADEEYYLLDEGGRARLAPPFVDPTVYVDWNAHAARALLRGAAVLGRPELADPALRLLDRLCKDARRGDAMAHFVHPDGETGDGPPLLGDQAAAAAAALDAYEVTADRRWLRRARTLTRWTVDNLRQPDGRLLDRLAVPGESAGLLAHAVPALEENAAMAEVLLRLEAYTGEARLREQALELLAAWAAHHEQYGVQAASYAQALLRYLERPDQIVVVGRRDDPEARRLHGAALTAAAPLRTVQWLDPADSADAERLREAALPGDATSAAAAYVCRGHTCTLFEA
ncbi:MAG TPA: DUF255 domain-containing protein [Thermoleophilia bacterium]|nr:DUF255 domain-containing protein [Thermoleophilia bacterium]